MLSRFFSDSVAIVEPPLVQRRASRRLLVEVHRWSIDRPISRSRRAATRPCACVSVAIRRPVGRVMHIRRLPMAHQSVMRLACITKPIRAAAAT